MKKAIESKTLWFNSVVAILAMAEQNLPALEGVVPPSWYPWIQVAIAVVNGGLRVVTTKSLAFTKTR